MSLEAAAVCYESALKLQKHFRVFVRDPQQGFGRPGLHSASPLPILQCPCLNTEQPRELRLRKFGTRPRLAPTHLIHGLQQGLLEPFQVVIHLQLRALSQPELRRANCRVRLCTNGIKLLIALRWQLTPDPSRSFEACFNKPQIIRFSERLPHACTHAQAGCAVNLTPSARATFITVSNRGFAPGASAL